MRCALSAAVSTKLYDAFVCIRGTYHIYWKCTRIGRLRRDAAEASINVKTFFPVVKHTAQKRIKIYNIGIEQQFGKIVLNSIGAMKTKMCVPI